MKNIYKQLQSLSIFGGGVLAHHYGSKLLDYKNDQVESQIQEERDAKLDEIAKGVKQLTNNCKDITSYNNKDEKNISSETLDNLNEQIRLADNKGKEVMNSLDQLSKSASSGAKDNMYKDVNEMLSITDQIKKILNDISNSKDGNSLISSLEDLYKYLDSLSLLEESSLLHIFIFLAILFSILNILVVLFSNEIIKYFNIENKYPILRGILELRYKYQRYYIIWNTIILILICIGGICINILTLYCLR